MWFRALLVSGQIAPSLADGQDTLDHILTAGLVGLVSLGNGRAPHVLGRPPFPHTSCTTIPPLAHPRWSTE